MDNVPKYSQDEFESNYNEILTMVETEQCIVFVEVEPDCTIAIYPSDRFALDFETQNEN